VKPPRKRGAPPGNRNRLKTGKYTKRNRRLRSQIAVLKRSVRGMVPLAEAAMKARELA